LIRHPKRTHTIKTNTNTNTPTTTHSQTPIQNELSLRLLKKRQTFTVS